MQADQVKRKEGIEMTTNDYISDRRFRTAASVSEAIEWLKTDSPIVWDPFRVPVRNGAPCRLT